MGKLAQWEFGVETIFDGERDFAEIESATVFARATGRLVIWATPLSEGAAVLLAHSAEAGEVEIGVTDAGAAYVAGDGIYTESAAGAFRTGEPTEITLAWGKEDTPDRMSLRRAGQQGVRHEVALPEGLTLQRPGGGTLVVGAGPRGQAPHFHGRVHKITLWDSPGATRPATHKDVLDLSGQGPFQVRFPSDRDAPGYVDRTAANRPVTVPIDDPARVVPSFTFGTDVATPEGPRRVELLRSGDDVNTRDNGVRPLRWVGHSTLDWPTLRANAHLRPILIRRGALGDGLPLRDMQVSPNHRLWVRPELSRIESDEKIMLIAAKHLVDNRGVYEVDAMGVTYVRLMFDQPQSVLINGIWAECYQPGAEPAPESNAQRAELYELFPSLKRPRGSAYFD